MDAKKISACSSAEYIKISQTVQKVETECRKLIKVVWQQILIKLTKKKVAIAH